MGRRSPATAARTATSSGLRVGGMAAAVRDGGFPVVVALCRRVLCGESRRGEMEWMRTGEDDAAERAHGLNEAQPLRLLWSTTTSQQSPQSSPQCSSP